MSYITLTHKNFSLHGLQYWQSCEDSYLIRSAIKVHSICNYRICLLYRQEAYGEYPCRFSCRHGKHGLRHRVSYLLPFSFLLPTWPISSSSAAQHFGCSRFEWWPNYCSSPSTDEHHSFSLCRWSCSSCKLQTWQIRSGIQHCRSWVLNDERSTREEYRCQCIHSNAADWGWWRKCT